MPKGTDTINMAVFGGGTRTGDVNRILNDLWILKWDRRNASANSGEWMQVGQGQEHTPSPRIGHTLSAVELASRPMLLLYGGMVFDSPDVADGDSGTPSDHIFVYMVHEDKWLQLLPATAVAPGPTFFAQSLVLGSGKTEAWEEDNGLEEVSGNGQTACKREGVRVSE